MKGFFDKFNRKGQPPEPGPELYTAEEISIIEEHIAAHFGVFHSVFHEIISPDLHIDIVIIEPQGERDYYTLVTMGMGAHRMQTPPELDEYQLERLELVICLPREWKLPTREYEVTGGVNPEDDPEHPSHENWYWPIRWLKTLARLPKENNTWLGVGHTVPNGADAEPLAANTNFCCQLLIPAILFDEAARSCPMPDGSRVNFLQMLPILKDEMELKLEQGVEALFDYFGAEDAPDSILVVDNKRPSAVTSKLQ